MIEMTPAEAQQWLSETPGACLIDCREPDEYEICKIPGSKLIPLSTWAATATAQLPDPGQPLIIHCHHGMRSQRAAEFLIAKGYSDVRNLGGGIDQWSLDIDSSIPRY